MRAATLAGVLALLLVLGASGCSAVSAWNKTTSVSDPNNLFHFKVPQSWQVSTKEGFVSVYADKRLPESGEQPDALALLVFSSTTPSTTPVPGMLDYLIDARARSRGWSEVKKGKVASVKVGERPGSSMDMSAKGTDSKVFESRYYFVRVDGGEAFLVAVAPTGKAIKDYDADLAKITDQWYWQGSIDASSESSESTPASGK